MPQMAPISWLILFITFSLTFMLFNVMNYYAFIPPSPKSSITQTKVYKTLNWKW
uniref:ATP synthase complex subunit 8 n=1 Tax=Prosthiochaeta sp. CAU WL-2019511 TaxID=2813900 RepID=A0A895KY22_9MUSC|nr:ATP synthase F0 subunit 8 [Prosthiochaeta sp. CAU WL-2019511]